MKYRSIAQIASTTCLASVLALGSFTLGCDDDSDYALTDDAVTVSEGYAAIAEANYADALALARVLDDAIQAFVAAPTPQGFEAAKQAWLAARVPYLQTEVFRFYDGPIDNAENGPEGLINAWPLDEGHIDYIAGPGGEASGIVNNPALFPVIDAATLEAQNEAGGEKNIATGFHAIEFLLWGQDLDPMGPGARPYTDYVTDGTGTNAHQDRRGMYLSTVSTMLVGHLQQVYDAWTATPGNYRESFLNAGKASTTTRILTGMIALSGFETGGERLQTALDTNDQEDEHSCFSDNTHVDMIEDIRGISNIWNGSYTRLDGSAVTSSVSLSAMVSEADSALSTEVSQRIATALSQAQGLQVPFDREIAADNIPGNMRVKALVQTLLDLEVSLAKVFELYELDVPVIE